MRVEHPEFGLISVLLAFVTIFSIVFTTPPVSAGGVTSTPAGKTIVVAPSQEFLLRHELYFDESSYGGVFAMAIYWDAPSSDENFSLENNPSIYWISGPESGSPVENVQVVVQPSDNVMTIGIYIDSGDKNYIDGHFNVDVWLRASGGDNNTPHRLGSQQLSYGVAIAVTESTIKIAQPENVTIDVRATNPPPVNKEFPLLPVTIAAVIAIAAVAILMVWIWQRPRGPKPSV